MAELDLTGIGTAADLFDTKGGSPLERFLLDWLNEKVVELKGELRESGRIGTGSLEQSIAVEVVGNLDMRIMANDYWDFINEGVDGVDRKFGSPYSFKSLRAVGDMVESMEDSKWAATKGLKPGVPFTTRDGRSITPPKDQTMEDMLFAIAVGVKKQGIKPSHFFDIVMTDEAIDEFTNKIADDFGEVIRTITFPEIPKKK